LGSRPKQRPSLLGPAARTASRSERFEANRRRRLLGRDRAPRDAPSVCLTGEGSKAASVWPQTKRIGAGRLPQRCAAFWVPDQNAPTRGFLAQARSAANAATAARRTPQEGRQCPPLVRTPPASLVHRSVRAQCRGVLRCGPGRVGGACLGKK